MKVFPLLETIDLSLIGLETLNIGREVPGANGQRETIEETKASLQQAIELIMEDRKADILRGLHEDAIQDTVMIK